MTISAEAVARVVSLNNHSKLIGKTRFQKSIYFLEEMDVGFGFNFTYHHYGPYCEDVSISLADANALKFLSIDWEVTDFGARYAVMKSMKNFEEHDNDARRKEILSILSEFDSVTLELAATADYLDKNGFSGSSAWDETANRKSTKATPDRIEKAQSLLKKLQS